MSLDDPYSFENLWRQYRACRRNKRNTLNALAFEVDAEANLLALQAELRSHAYEPGRSICFVTRGPKPREVFAADFRDRVVHHLLVSRQEPLFERRFIHDSYACRKGKGTLAASDALLRMLRRLTANGRRQGWALKLDVASFFSSIDKAILYDIIAGAIHDPDVLWLTRVVLFHDPTRNYRVQSLGGRAVAPTSPNYPVPERKSLFGKNGLRGLPIGNLTSQFWANVYLDVLDRFVKRTLRCRFYVRYVDDLVLLSTEREQLQTWRTAIEQHLRARLALELRSGGCELAPVARGVEFVGWKAWWNRRLVRRQTLGNLGRALDDFERRHARRAFGGKALRLELTHGRRVSRKRRRINRSGARAVESMGDLRATLASYGGHLRHGACWTVWRRAWISHCWLDGVFEDGKEWRATPRWLEINVAHSSGYGQRYRRAIRHAGSSCLVFWPHGRYIEFHGPQRLLAERVLGLRRARLIRGDYALTAGFPRYLVARFAARAIDAGLTVVLVRTARCEIEFRFVVLSPVAPRSDLAISSAQ